MVAYRADIDGLRAVAVVPIVLFHAGVSTLSGGFIGVDIFFVISGFLITRIICDDLAENTFSIGKFYKRRAARILPALFAMLTVVLVAGWRLLLPTELKELGESAAASAGFVSNLYFWSTADYFATAAESQPLLHTWSLGVEEQFYLFYPALLLLLRWRAPTRVRLALALIAAASFLLAALLAGSHRAAAFYLLPTRVWELGLGALAALNAAPQLGSQRMQSIAAALGVALIGISYLAVRPGMPFPAPWAAPSCIGAACILAYGRASMVGKALSWFPLRFVGKISYSLYLWHWPVITFYRLEHGVELHRNETLALTAISFVLATLSYVLVERPCIRALGRQPERRVLPAAAAAIVVMAATPLLVILDSQWFATQRFGAHVAQIASYLDYSATAEHQYQFRPGPCFRTSRYNNNAFKPDACIRLVDNRPNVVVLGDSHAAQYWRALQLRYTNANVVQATASGCLPTDGGGGERRCREVIDYVLGGALDSGKVDTLVLAGRWTSRELPSLRATIERAKAKVRRVVVLGPTAEYKMDFPSIAAHALQRRDSALPQRLYDRERRQVDRDYARYLAGAGALYVSVLDIECPADRCRMFAPDGAPMQFDYGHLTLSGAKWVVAHMPDFFTPAPRVVLAHG